MKSLARLTAMAALTFALTSLTYAKNADKNEGSFTLTNAVRVGSTDLPAGHYKAEWSQQSGNAVKVDILQHGKTVATVEGKLKDLQQPSPYNAVTTKPLNNNAVTIDEIDFNNRSQALVFGE